MKTAAILGASGFLGSELCALLRARKFNLLLSSRNGGSFFDIPISKVDLTKSGVLAPWFGQKIDVIFYLSSIMPHEFQGHQFLAFNQNIKMHEEVSRLWVKQRCHLVYASTGAVYGHSPVPWCENSLASPESFYALSKLAGEQIFDIIAKNEHLPLTSFRIKAPYGFKENNKTVVNVFMERAISNLDLELFGQGKRRQDFIYIKDVAQAFWLAFSRKQDGVYNLASGKTVTMAQLAKIIIRLTGSKSRIVFKDQFDLQENIKVKMDMNKTIRHLGFRPQYSLEDGLKDMVRYYQRGGVLR